MSLLKLLLVAVTVAGFATATISEYESMEDFDFDPEEFEIDSRIIQGENAARGQFPYYVFLQVLMGSRNASCGGVLISDQWVVTAAHCLRRVSKADVHLGSLKATDLREKGRVLVKVEKNAIHIHPRFFLPLIMNDIGLIKLPKPVELSDVIRPVRLACSSRNNMDVIAIGNGMMHDGIRKLAPTLQYTSLKTVSKLKCLPFFPPQMLLRRNVICVKGKQRRSVCNGDSGGPLVSAEKQGLIGLTSFGSAFGCELHMPQGFTRVSSHLKWIQQVTGISDCINV